MITIHNIDSIGKLTLRSKWLYLFYNSSIDQTPGEIIKEYVAFVISGRKFVNAGASTATNSTKWMQWWIIKNAG